MDPFVPLYPDASALTNGESARPATFAARADDPEEEAAQMEKIMEEAAQMGKRRLKPAKSASTDVRALASEEEAPAKRVAPSKQDYPAFIMDFRHHGDFGMVLQILDVVQKMLSQNSKGGTDSVLRLVVVFSTVPIKIAPKLLEGPSRNEGVAPMLLEGPSRPSRSLDEHPCTITMGEGCLSLQSASALTFDNTQERSDFGFPIDPMVRLAFIYDNQGRNKSVVKRNLLKHGPNEVWWQMALDASLKPIPIPEILAQVIRTPASFMFESWLGGNNYGKTLQQYLKNRCPDNDMRNSTRLLQHGLDPLAPPRRTLEAASETLSSFDFELGCNSAPLPRSGPSTSAPDTTEVSAQLIWPRSVEADGLRTLLRGCRTLSEDLVAARSDELLKIFSTILEENSRLKIAAEAAAARDAEDVRLEYNTALPPMLLALHPEYNSC